MKWGWVGTYGVDEEEIGRKELKESLDAVLDLLLGGNTRRVDIVDTRADLVGVAVLPEGRQELEVALGGFDGDDIGIETLDRGEDVVEVGVTEMGVGLGGIGNTGGRELEGVDGPAKVAVPVNPTKGETFTDGGLIDLDGLDTSLLEVDDFVTESKGQLAGLGLAGDVNTRERPVKDGNGACQHALHGVLGQALGVAAPLDGDGTGAADVGDDDGGTDIARAVALYPTVLGEDETVETFTEVLNHVVTFGFTMDEEVQTDLLLEADNHLDLLLDELFVFLLGDLALGELSTSRADLLGLL